MRTGERQMSCTSLARFRAVFLGRLLAYPTVCKTASRSSMMGRAAGHMANLSGPLVS